MYQHVDSNIIREKFSLVLHRSLCTMKGWSLILVDGKLVKHVHATVHHDDSNMCCEGSAIPISYLFLFYRVQLP